MIDGDGQMAEAPTPEEIEEARAVYAEVLARVDEFLAEHYVESEDG